MSIITTGVFTLEKQVEVEVKVVSFTEICVYAQITRPDLSTDIAYEAGIKWMQEKAEVLARRWLEELGVENAQELVIEFHAKVYMDVWGPFSEAVVREIAALIKEEGGNQ